MELDNENLTVSMMNVFITKLLRAKMNNSLIKPVDIWADD